MGMSVLLAQGLSKRFGARQALDRVGVTVGAGHFVVLLGPAGAGKTTTLRIIAGLEIPNAGRVEIDGIDVTAREPKDRNVAMIFDSLALYPDKTGFANIAAPLKLRGLDAAAIRAKVAAVAETLRIGEILDRLPRTMSGGERQRVALGRALVRDPALFLLDEPLSSLDAQLRVALRAELRRLQRERGASFLYATPDFAEALAVADEVIVLLEGQVRQTAPPQDLYDRPIDRDVARFVGAPEINLVPAEYDCAEGGQVRIAGITTPASPEQLRIFDGRPARFEAGLRPEHVFLDLPGARAANGRVIDLERLGMRATVTLDTGQGQLRATIDERDAARFATGTAVSISLAAERSLCFDPTTGRRLG